MAGYKTLMIDELSHALLRTIAFHQKRSMCKIVEELVDKYAEEINGKSDESNQSTAGAVTEINTKS